MIKFNIADKPAKGFDHLIKPANTLQVGEVFVSACYVEDVIKGEPILNPSGFYCMALYLHSDGDIICLRLGKTEGIDKGLEYPYDENADEVCSLAMFTYIGCDEKVLPVELTVSKVEASV